MIDVKNDLQIDWYFENWRIKSQSKMEEFEISNLYSECLNL